MTGLLEYLIEVPVEQLSIGSEVHAGLRLNLGKTIERCLHRDHHKCQFCGISIPAFMEVEHKEHVLNSELNNVFTVCRICHQLRHFIWASQREKIRMFWLPDIPQVAINRMAWATIDTYRVDGYSPFASSVPSEVLACIERREIVLRDILGSSDPLALIEGLYCSRRYLDSNTLIERVRVLDGFIRFWPSELMLMHQKEEDLSQYLET